MKKKYFTAIFLVVGLILICLSIILAIIATANKDVIGGADFSTFLLVFSRGRGRSLFYTCILWNGIVSYIRGFRIEKKMINKMPLRNLGGCGIISL